MTSQFKHATIAANLVRALTLHNIESPEKSVIENKAANYFSTTDLHFINKIHEGQLPKADWHYVEEINIKSNKSKFYCANSLIEAIGYVIEKADEAGTILRAEFDYDDDVFEFVDVSREIVFYDHEEKDGHLLIKPNVFRKEIIYKVGALNTVALTDSDRKEFVTALKGIRLYDNSGKLNARLKKIDGFKNISVTHSNEVHSPSPALVTMVENFPGFMRSLLQDEFGIEVKLSKILEITAVTFGFKDWNTFKAMGEKYRCSINNPFILMVLNGDERKIYCFDDVIGSLTSIQSLYGSNNPNSSYFVSNISLVDNFTLEIELGSTERDNENKRYMSLMSSLEDIPLRYTIPKCILGINIDDVYDAEEEMNKLFCASTYIEERNEAAVALISERNDERYRLDRQIGLF
jgi:hypothetical protein